MQPGNPDRYVLSRSQEERQRLLLQDELLSSMTRSLFQRAGLREGSRVLDVGSGVGGVALLASTIVGTSGSVVGVEIDAESAAMAVDRCAVAGVSNVTFLVDDVATATLPGPFDAVVGRLILMHLRDPIAILARSRGMLRPNGLWRSWRESWALQDSPSQGRKAWRSLNVCVCGRLVACQRTCLWVWTCDACSSMRGSESLT
jgi:ubiquinone/menaquinone biosynthesis C-methylase UbiE